MYAKDFVCLFFWRRYKIELNINVININFYILNIKKKDCCLSKILYCCIIFYDIGDLCINNGNYM